MQKKKRKKSDVTNKSNKMTEWAGNLTEKILALKKAVSVSFQHSGFSQ